MLNFNKKWANICDFRFLSSKNLSTFRIFFIFFQNDPKWFCGDFDANLRSIGQILLILGPKNVKFVVHATIGLRHHRSRFIFTDFRGFWAYFGGKMHYMSMLQRMASISKLEFWKNFGGPTSRSKKKIFCK